MPKSCATLWTVTHQAPLSMGFSRHEYWSGLPFSTPGDLPGQGLNLCLLNLLHCQDACLLLAPPGKAGIKITQLDKGHLFESLKSNRNSNFLIFNLANKYFL